MVFLWPTLLWLLLAVPLLVLLYWWLLHRRKKTALTYSSLSLVREAHRYFAKPLGKTIAVALKGPRPEIFGRKPVVVQDPFAVAKVPVVIGVGDPRS